MVLVEAADVGVAAWRRMVREGVITPLTDTSGHARDIRGSSALRAMSVTHAVPQRASLTGLCALWIYGWNADAAGPALIEVTVPRGSHPDAPPGVDASRWSFVTDQIACRTAQLVGGVAVVLPAHAVAGALARAPLAWALESAWWALRVGLVDTATVNSALHATGRTRSSARARSAWDALCAASGDR
jgi:hypothetical protein